MSEHGGNIAQAAARYGIAAERWLDLSTGISPIGYPVPPLDASAWQRLPYDEARLLDAAAAYYGTAELLPVPGSQAAIQLLARLLGVRSVAIVSPTYGEYRPRWERAGAVVMTIAPEDARRVAAEHTQCELLIVCNPNNPTGHLWSRDELRALHASLRARGAWLLVDEAFMDTAPESSLMPETGAGGLIVLRSIGKFFGLAGARVGFVAAPRALRERLRAELGPWSISGPSLAAASAALADSAFQQRARADLRAASARLAALLRSRGYTVAGLTHFFVWIGHADARSIQDKLAAHAILVRAFDDPPSLRIGLPGNETEWERLSDALDKLR